MEKNSMLCRSRKAITLIELIVAMTLMVIIFTAMVPQFHIIRTSWANNEATSTIIQNGIVFDEHINRNLSAAAQLVSVSPSSATNGFIIYKDTDGNQKRYMVSDGNVVFGTVGSEEPLAGPVSRFQVSCYSLNNFASAITDVNNIRFVEIQTNFTNSAKNRTFTTSAYLQSNASGIVGCWKMDETSGTIAADTSGNENDGTLQGTPLPTWGSGQINGALTLATGGKVYVPSGPAIDFTYHDMSVSLWAIQPVSLSGQYELVIKGTIGSGAFPGSGKRYEVYRKWDKNYNQFRFAVDDNVTKSEVVVNSPTSFCTGNWVHIAAVRDTVLKQLRLYADGVLKGTVTDNTTGSISQNEPLYIGDGVFTGSIDDVRIYNRALTQAEITELASTLRYKAFNEAKNPTP